MLGYSKYPKGQLSPYVHIDMSIALSGQWIRFVTVRY